MSNASILWEDYIKPGFVGGFTGCAYIWSNTIQFFTRLFRTLEQRKKNVEVELNALIALKDQQQTAYERYETSFTEVGNELDEFARRYRRSLKSKRVSQHIKELTDRVDTAYTEMERYKKMVYKTKKLIDKSQTSLLISDESVATEKVLSALFMNGFSTSISKKKQASLRKKEEALGFDEKSEQAQKQEEKAVRNAEKEEAITSSEEEEDESEEEEEEDNEEEEEENEEENEHVDLSKILRNKKLPWLKLIGDKNRKSRKPNYNIQKMINALPVARGGLPPNPPDDGDQLDLKRSVVVMINDDDEKV